MARALACGLDDIAGHEVQHLLEHHLLTLHFLIIASMLAPTCRPWA